MRIGLKVSALVLASIALSLSPSTWSPAAAAGSRTGALVRLPPAAAGTRQSVFPAPPAPVQSTSSCADPNGDGKITALDALWALQAAVHLIECPNCACDIDNTKAVMTTDALAILMKAVGWPVALQCEPCVVDCSSVEFSDEDLAAAAEAAVGAFDDPWGEDLASVIERVFELLQCEPSAALVAGAGFGARARDARDCLHQYCSDAHYCGAPSNSVTAPVGAYFSWLVSDCINQACFKHDLDSFEACISGSKDPWGFPTGKPDCYFSPQSTAPDSDFLTAFDNCPATLGNRILQWIVKKLQQRANVAADCDCLPCTKGVNCSQREGYCNPGQGTCDSDCAYVGGSWYVTESARLCCKIYGSTECDDIGGSGYVYMNQAGCNVSYVVPNTGGVTRSGSVTGDDVTLSGIAAITAPGVVVTKNVLTLHGTFDGERIPMTGQGSVVGSLDGAAFSCTVTTDALFERPVQLAAAGGDGGTHEERSAACASTSWLLAVTRSCR